MGKIGEIGNTMVATQIFLAKHTDHGQATGWQSTGPCLTYWLASNDAPSQCTGKDMVPALFTNVAVVALPASLVPLTNRLTHEFKPYRH